MAAAAGAAKAAIAQAVAKATAAEEAKAAAEAKLAEVGAQIVTLQHELSLTERAWMQHAPSQPPPAAPPTAAASEMTIDERMDLLFYPMEMTFDERLDILFEAREMALDERVSLIPEVIHNAPEAPPEVTLDESILEGMTLDEHVDLLIPKESDKRLTNGRSRLKSTFASSRQRVDNSKDWIGSTQEKIDGGAIAIRRDSDKEKSAQTKSGVSLRSAAAAAAVKGKSLSNASLQSSKAKAVRASK